MTNALIPLVLATALLAAGAPVEVKEPSVNVRGGPGVDHDVVAHVYKGEVLEATGRVGSWIQVRIPEKGEGWIYAPLLTSTPEGLPEVQWARPDPLAALPRQARDNLLRTSTGEVPVPAYIPGRSYEAAIATSLGEIVVELWPETAPNHVKNFMHLAGTDFYDGLTIHRVAAGFVAQGGDPEGTGRGGPGYTIALESSDRPHVKGVLSMARRRPPDTAGSQFFLMLGRAPHLDGKYSAFGQVVQGMEVLDAIGRVEVDDWSRPKEPVLIEDVAVRERPERAEGGPG